MIQAEKSIKLKTFQMHLLKHCLVISKTKTKKMLNDGWELGKCFSGYYHHC